MRKVIAAVVLWTLLAPPQAAFAQAAFAQAAAELHPGDVVRVVVWREPELSGEFTVAADSTLVHPLYRQVRVAGVPLWEVEVRIENLLRRYQTNPEFVVEPLFRVAVGGEVRQPNLYTLAPTATVAEAVAIAGGPTERGRIDRVTLIRGTTERVVDLTDPSGEGTRLRIRSGDRVTVGSRSSVFRDYIVPAFSVTGAIATIVNLFLGS